ncbi:MAG: hypothetical protein ACLTW9_14920 [Enterocloster sp.]
MKKGLEKFKYMWDQGWFPESGLTGNRETMQQLFVQKELVQVMLQPNYLSYLTENVPEEWNWLLMPCRAWRESPLDVLADPAVSRR